jgi:hypothetical protein
LPVWATAHYSRVDSRTLKVVKSPLELLPAKKEPAKKEPAKKEKEKTS